RVAATFDRGHMRAELARLNAVTVRHHPDSTVAAMLLLGWLASRLGWALQQAEIVSEKLREGRLSATARADGREVSLALQADPHLTVPGLAGLDLSSESGLRISLDRGPGGLHARRRDGDGSSERRGRCSAPRVERGESSARESARRCCATRHTGRR